MKCIIPLLLLLPIFCRAQDALPFDQQMTHHVYKIVYPAKGISGTGFIVKWRDSCYLITAKHLFKDEALGDTVSIIITGGGSNWLEISRPIYFLLGADIAVLPIRSKEAPNVRRRLDTVTKFKPGTPVLFAGYPSNRVLDSTFSINTITKDGAVHPLIKRGWLSGFDESNPQDMRAIFDFQSVPGFSGSPIYGWDAITNQPKIIAVLGGGYVSGASVVRNGELQPVNDLFYQTSLSYGTLIGYVYHIIDKLIPR